ncbi:hypothetical protein EES42_39005 [Streptomyces sp. ADI95-17]|nr:hypothetical protein EES42_39005 [Streptomyces sp. ADI95-17]
MPARSNASQEVSRSSRCCGSIPVASRGEIPKKTGSKSPTSRRNPPSVTYEVPAWSGSGSYSESRSQPRSTGNPVTPSVPAASSSHSSSGVRTPPGKRQLMPTIAIGSSGSVTTVAVAAAITSRAPVCSASPPNSSDRRCSARTVGVGWSNTMVAGSLSPVPLARRLRSSTAVSESKPSSRKVLAAVTESALPCARTTAAWLRTRSSSARVRSAPVAAASRSRRAEAPSSAAAVTSSWRSRTSGRPVRSGLGRSAVNTGANRVQSTSATVTWVSRSASACCRAATARSGAMAGSPRRNSSASASPAAMPPSAHGPQLMEVAVRPRARRSWARASRWALAAA